MRYLSLFSGIEAATQAWHPLGWTPVAFAETDPFCSALLAKHYPNVPNLGDVTAITDRHIAALGDIDVVVGGSPCQDLSIAGTRQGLSGQRSSLFFEHVRLFNAARSFGNARFLVWENVPGALSSNKGRDFTDVVNALAGCRLPVPGEGWEQEGVALGDHGLLEWSVLDAQWFGLAQRRKRLFAVLDTGRWADRAPILLERDSVRGDTTPCRKAKTQTPRNAHTAVDETGANSVNTVGACKTPHTKSGGLGISDQNVAYTLGTKPGQENAACTLDAGKGQTIALPEVSMCLNAGGMGRLDAESETFIAIGFDSQNACLTTNFNCAPALSAANGNARLAVHVVHGSQDPDVSVDVAHTVGRNQGAENVLHDPSLMEGVRRLTPRECERLQGFPDDYTQIVWRGRPAERCPDAPRYRALGNSMAVPVMRWIGKQIEVALCKNA